MISQIRKLAKIFKKHGIKYVFIGKGADDIIENKIRTRRQRDKEELPRLESFRDVLKRTNRQ